MAPSSLFPNPPARKAPSRAAFLEQLETLFGTADPDFDRYGNLLHQRYEEELQAGHEDAADTLWKVHRVPLDVACEAFQRWDELDADTKRSVLDLLKTYEEELETTDEASKLG